MSDYLSIQPGSGYYGDSWPDKFAIPESLSTGGWTKQSEGYEQQTFLGASITRFTMNGGYGDTSSTLSVDLVVDEYNKSDGTNFGDGDDVYHSGKRDQFIPPFVGSPVFFKFGKYRSSVEDAFYNAIDELATSGEIATRCSGELYEEVGSETKKIYEITALQGGTLLDLETGKIVKPKKEGKSCALTFGGILQSYTQSRTTNGNPLYSVQVVDPREILGNVKILLNNYTGSIHDNDNIINVYGFLEYEPTPQTVEEIKSFYGEPKIIKRSVDDDGYVSFSGSDTYTNEENPEPSGGSGLAPSFPITGIGFSRRSEQGIPFYRINQSLQSLLEVKGELPKEYKDAKFCNKINFRGFNYIVDLGGIPTLPDFYYIDFDEMSLLELSLEICDVVNRDLFVSLLPVIDHPYCKFLYDKNSKFMNENPSGFAPSSGNNSSEYEFIAGIIRCDAIDRSEQPEIGAIKSYLDDLEKQNIYVENRDVGFEVSNIVTDKIIAGAQTADMYFFSSFEDRKYVDDDIGSQWKLETQYNQQVLPYYGVLDENIATIPKGFGSYQQILLDARNLNANGVGDYYVATEMEIRCAMISYRKWVDFLMQYNDKYMESTEEDDILQTQKLKGVLTDEIPDPVGELPNISNNYEVTVPRSVFPCMSYNDTEDEQFDGSLPKSACNPPYGYPLYYKRATQLGIPEAGLVKISYTWNSQILPALAELRQHKDKNSENFKVTMNSTANKIKQLYNIVDPDDGTTPEYLKDFVDFVIKQTEDIIDKGIDAVIGLIEDRITNIQKTMTTLPQLARKGTQNAKRVHDFLKNIGSECLGKKFLVKLPQKTNLNFQNDIKIDAVASGENPSNRKISGPFGFKPLPKGSGMADVDEEYSDAFKKSLETARIQLFELGGQGQAEGQEEGQGEEEKDIGMSLFLRYDLEGQDETNRVFKNFRGALDLNYNPFADRIESNYYPEPQGGFFVRSQYKDLIDDKAENTALKNKSSRGVRQKLIPNILLNFTTENKRIHPYVRFDNSQFLSFDGLSQSNFIQSTVDGENSVPDLAYNLDNLDESNTDFTRFYNKNDEESDNEKKKQVAFVKCDVSPKIFFAAPLEKRKITVYGSKVKDEPLIFPPRQVVTESGEIKYTHGYWISNFIPDIGSSGSSTESSDGSDGSQNTDNSEGGSGNQTVEIYDFVRTSQKNSNDEVISSGVIDTDPELLAESGVAYVLITLPGRIAPTKDSRFRDGPYQLFKPESIKHFLTMDVVKGLPEFEQPAFKGDPPKLINCELEGEKAKNANKIHETVMESLQFAFPQAVDLSIPSPVYPDLISIPLLSTERFYGPWFSSEIDTREEKEQVLKQKESEAKSRYKDLGGAVDFSKDENLAPWNYFGYSKMNEAGKIRAKFANSLLLLSERGGFVVPDAPSGLTLGKELKNKGPLVTNISVDVSTQGVRTTAQLDLYTVSFGKLQKQKELEIQRSSRERKKLSDERNALLRKGLGKSQVDQRYDRIYADLEDKIKVLQSLTNITSKAENKPATDLVATVTSEIQKRFEPKQNGVIKTTEKTIRRGIDISAQNQESIGEVGENFPNAIAASKSYYNSAGGSFKDIYSPASMEPYHQNMPYRPDTSIATKDLLYGGDEQNSDNITFYED